MCEIYLEVGKKRVLAAALHWPGWARSGRDEASATAALLAAAPRYERAMQAAGLRFGLPNSTSDFAIEERLPGTSGTDFGVPSLAPGYDAREIDAQEHRRLAQILDGCWQAFDRAAAEAEGHDLKKGPRGGGRDLDGIIRHVVESNAGYLSMIGARAPRIDSNDTRAAFGEMHGVVIDALAGALEHGVPTSGPRGGARWSPRYFVRRVAWHILDHAWEIEDRVVLP